MNYKYGLTIPAGTAGTSPMEITAHLPSGILGSGIASFPAGCEGLVGFRVLRGIHQIWPENTPAWLIGDDHTFSIPFDQELRSAETLIRILAYNADAVNDHTISIQFNVSALEDKSTALLGIVTAKLEPGTVSDLAAITQIYKNALEFRETLDNKIIPLLDGIWERLDPTLTVRLRDLSLEELSRL